jgi:hypothetical protein
MFSNSNGLGQLFSFVRLPDFDKIQYRKATLSQKFYHAAIVGVNVVVDGILTVRSSDFLCFAV